MTELIIEAKTENLDEVLDHIHEILDEQNASMKVQMQIDLAVEEIFVNIASYAYGPGEGMATVQTSILDDPKAIRITFMDEGIPYNPLEREDPDVTLSADDRKIGGLGVYLVKKTMDHVEYVYEDHRNKLTFVKVL